MITRAHFSFHWYSSPNAAGTNCDHHIDVIVKKDIETRLKQEAPGNEPQAGNKTTQKVFLDDCQRRPLLCTFILKRATC